jgi:hypothetical protein
MDDHKENAFKSAFMEPNRFYHHCASWQRPLIPALKPLRFPALLCAEVVCTVMS